MDNRDFMTARSGYPSSSERRKATSMNCDVTDLGDIICWHKGLAPYQRIDRANGLRTVCSAKANVTTQAVIDISLAPFQQFAGKMR
ncbi:MAG: hypothetical protein KUG58_10555, partial [Marinosulfonomonas sp.]|nr:hypothetical protein [Marinosulfonomonas sp.]